MQTTNPASPLIAGHTIACADVPPEQQLTVMRRVMAEQLRLIPLSPDFKMLGDMSQWSCGDLVVTLRAASAAHYERPREFIQRAARRWLMLRILRRGTHTLSTEDGTYYRAESGDVALVDWGTPFVSSSTDYEMLSVAIPREQLANTQLLARNPVLNYPGDSHEGRLLLRAVEGLYEQLPSMRTEQAVATSAALIGLVDGLLGSSRDALRSHYLNDPRLSEMCASLRRDIEMAEAGVATLCAEFDCSRATVYRVFSPVGGVSSYLARLRLHRAMRAMVTNQRPTAALLDKLASRWHFGSRSHFCAAFQREFGIPARQVLAARSAYREHTSISDPSTAYWRHAVAISNRLLQSEPAPAADA